MKCHKLIQAGNGTVTWTQYGGSLVFLIVSRLIELGLRALQVGAGATLILPGGVLLHGPQAGTEQGAATGNLGRDEEFEG
jgi:hypothetical protein